MNIYDPADGIVYVHLSRDGGPHATTLDTECVRLPAGYADGSPLTSLRRRRSRPQEPAPWSPGLSSAESRTCAGQ